MSLHDDLMHRLQRLDVAWAAMNTQPAQPIAGIATMAGWWAAALLVDNEQHGAEAAYQVLHYLIPEHEAAGSAFWATELGRAIARCGYAPVNESGQVPAATVGAILGFSRARAHELQQRGRLCTPGLVAAALREREGAAT